MQVIDLTHCIHPQMPLFPGSEPPTLLPIGTLQKEGFRETAISMSSHAGTHIDAPAHMLDSGPYLDNLSINHFIGKATVLDVSIHAKPIIDIDSLKSHQKRIETVDFILFKTGWDQFWGKQQYFHNYPYLSQEAASWLASFKLKGVGIDAISIDRTDSIDFLTHKMFLTHQMLIIENLTNLHRIRETFFVLSVLPLKTQKADGSPVRAIAFNDLPSL